MLSAAIVTGTLSQWADYKFTQALPKKKKLQNAWKFLG